MNYYQIDRFAHENFGLVDRAEVTAAGGSDREIERLIATKQWHQVHAGVYSTGSAQLPWLAQLRAATLATGPAGLISHRTAAELWGLEGVRYPRIEVTVPYLSRPIPAAILVHRTRRPMNPRSLKGVPVTSPERAILDTAACMPTPTIATLYDSGVRKGIITPTSMADCLFEDCKRGVRGRSKVLRVLDDRRLGHSRGSVAEVAALRLIRDNGVEEPERQYAIALPDGTVAVVDFAWPSRWKVIEIDGLVAHATARQLEEDLKRQNLILETGWDLRRFAARLVLQSPKLVASEIVRFFSS